MRAFASSEGTDGVLGIEGEFLFLDEEELGLALDRALRELSGRAALLDAVFEARVMREAHPVSAPAVLISALERELAEAGFEVERDVLWRPAPEAEEAEAWVGGGEELSEYLEGTPSWELT